MGFIAYLKSKPWAVYGFGLLFLAVVVTYGGYLHSAYQEMGVRVVQFRGRGIVARLNPHFVEKSAYRDLVVRAGGSHTAALHAAVEHEGLRVVAGDLGIVSAPGAVRRTIRSMTPAVKAILSACYLPVDLDVGDPARAIEEFLETRSGKEWQKAYGHQVRQEAAHLALREQVAPLLAGCHVAEGVQLAQKDYKMKLALFDIPNSQIDLENATEEQVRAYSQRRQSTHPTGVYQEVSCVVFPINPSTQEQEDAAERLKGCVLDLGACSSLAEARRCSGDDVEVTKERDTRFKRAVARSGQDYLISVQPRRMVMRCGGAKGRVWRVATSIACEANKGYWQDRLTFWEQEVRRGSWDRVAGTAVKGRISKRVANQLDSNSMIHHVAKDVYKKELRHGAVGSVACSPQYVLYRVGKRCNRAIPSCRREEDAAALDRERKADVVREVLQNSTGSQVKKTLRRSFGRCLSTKEYIGLARPGFGGMVCPEAVIQLQHLRVGECLVISDAQRDVTKVVVVLRKKRVARGVLQGRAPDVDDALNRFVADRMRVDVEDNRYKI